MKSIVCPSCGAKLAFVFQQSYLKCEYCGNVIKDETVDDTVRLENEVQNILTDKPYMWEYKIILYCHLSWTPKSQRAKK